MEHLLRLREQLTTIRYDLVSILSRYEDTNKVNVVECLKDAIETLDVVERLIEEARRLPTKEENHAVI